MNGARQEIAPEQPKPPPRLTIRLNNIVQAVVALPTHSSTSEADTVSQEELEDVNEEKSDGEDGDDDLYNQVGRLGEDKDSEDGPDWMFDEGETRSPDAHYVFCSLRRYIYISILGFSPLYMINVYGTNPTTQKTE